MIGTIDCWFDRKKLNLDPGVQPWVDGPESFRDWGERMKKLLADTPLAYFEPARNTHHAGLMIIGSERLHTSSDFAFTPAKLKELAVEEEFASILHAVTWVHVILYVHPRPREFKAMVTGRGVVEETATGFVIMPNPTKDHDRRMLISVSGRTIKDVGETVSEVLEGNLKPTPWIL